MGLASYDVGDSHLFFGRDAELEKIYKIINTNLSTVIYGESGVGKTSLIRAGLFPRLIHDNYLPVWIRLEHDSDEDYCGQIEHAILDEVYKNGCEIEHAHNLDLNLFTPSERLWLLLYSSIIWDGSNRKVYPVIFYDQFEEMFTLTTSSNAVASFFKDISDFSQQVPNTRLLNFLEESDCKLVPEDIPQIRFVYSLREDFLGLLENAASDCAYLFKNKTRIGKLNGEQALDIIVKPCPGLVDYPLEYNILKVLSGHEELPTDLTRIEIEPTILSLYCSELYVKACEQKQSKLTSDLVLSAGTDVIYDYYCKSIEDLHNETINYIERELITKNGYRKQLLSDDIDDMFLTKGTIYRLISRRILRTNNRKKILAYEFTHDVLCTAAKRHRQLRETHKSSSNSHIWSIDFILNIILINLTLSSNNVTFELTQNPLGLITFTSVIFGSLLMRGVNYASSYKVKYAAGINLVLSIFVIISLHHFSVPYRQLLDVCYVSGSLLHLYNTYYRRSKNHIKFISALKLLSQPQYIHPLKVAILFLTGLLCYHAGTIMNPYYSLFCCIAATLIFAQICLSFLINRTKLKLSHIIHFICVAGLYWLAAYRSSILLCVVIAFYLSSLLAWIPKKTDYILFMHKFKIRGVLISLFSFFLWASTSPYTNILEQIYGYHFTNEYKNLSRASSKIIYAIPETRVSSPESYLLDIKSMKERRKIQMILAMNEDGQLGLFHKESLVLPTGFVEIDNIVRYKPSQINNDGTVNLSDYLIRVKNSDADSTFSIIHLSDYLYLTNTFSATLKAELETYFHSSASARRRLDLYYQKNKNTDSDKKGAVLKSLIEKWFGIRHKQDLNNIKWLVLANRMKELLVLEESKITGHNNVNDLCEIFRKGLKTDGLNLSPEFMSAIRFLNALGEDPSAFTSDEILLRCHDLGLETAIKENMDILEGDPDFEIYVSHYSQQETEEIETCVSSTEGQRI